MKGTGGTLYTSFAPAGDPPSQSSGTLMSLQEGIAEPCARMCSGTPREGALTTHTEPHDTQIPILSCSPASCLRYLTPVFPFPPRPAQRKKPRDEVRGFESG